LQVENNQQVAREAGVNGKDEQSTSVLKKIGRSQRTSSSSRLQEVKHQHGEVFNPEGKKKPTPKNSRLNRLAGQPGNIGPFADAISVNGAGGGGHPSSTVDLSGGGEWNDAAPSACLSLASKGPRMPHQGHECHSA